MQFVAGAQTLFNEMPSSIRNRFSNDPAHFLDFCSNENNRAEMHEMGLLKPQSEWVIPPPPKNIITPPAANLVPSTPIPSPTPRHLQNRLTVPAYRYTCCLYAK